MLSIKGISKAYAGRTLFADMSLTGGQYADISAAHMGNFGE